MEKDVMTAAQARAHFAGKSSPAPKKKRSHPESKLQQDCFRWFRLQYPQYRKLFFAIPNGGARNGNEAKIMQGEGVVPGVADAFLSVPKLDLIPLQNQPTCANYSLTNMGLYIEFKVGKNKQTMEQMKFENAVKKMYYKYEVVRSFDEFQKIITEYLQ